MAERQIYVVQNLDHGWPLPYHHDVAEKIIGSVVVDAHHTSEDQLLAKAREFYAEFNRK